MCRDFSEGDVIDVNVLPPSRLIVNVNVETFLGKYEFFLMQHKIITFAGNI